MPRRSLQDCIDYIKYFDANLELTDVELACLTTYLKALRCSPQTRAACLAFVGKVVKLDKFPLTDQNAV